MGGLHAALAGIALAAGAAGATPPRVCVSIPPQRWVLQALAGDTVDVQVLVAPGQNPHTFEPTARQVAGLAEAQVYLAIGLPFEQALLAKARGARPGLPCVSVDAGIARRRLAAHEGCAHAHEEADPAGESHGGEDPHVWLSPANMARIATNSCRALVSVDAANRARYEAGLAAVTVRLAALQRALDAELAGCRGGTVLVYHPSWGYLTDAFGLRQLAIEEEGRAPTARQLARLIDAARGGRARTIFGDPQFDPRPVQTLAQQVGARVVLIDPLAGDWEANLLHVARQMRAALGGAAGGAGAP